MSGKTNELVAWCKETDPLFDQREYDTVVASGEQVTSGLLAMARGLSFDRVKADREVFGPLLESFVFSEVLKLMTASDMRLSPYHFRDQQMHEVDIVLERDDGMIVGIEVKAAATVKSGDFAGLRTLAEACKERFAYGVVLYDSTDLVPFGDRLAAAPLSSLWG